MRAGLGRQLAWYSSGTFLAAAASALLLILYARLLPPEELGVLTLVYGVVTVLRIFGYAGADMGMFRYLAGPPEDRKAHTPAQLVTTTFAIMLGGSAVLGLAALAAAPAVFGGLAAHDPLRLMTLAAATAVASAPRELAEFVLRAHARATAWSVYTAAASLVSAAAAAVAVLAIGATAEAILAVQLAGLTAVSLAGLALIRGDLRPRAVSLSAVRPLLRIGAPNSGAVLLDWAARYLDRFILLAFVTAAEIGIYSFGARLGLLVQQVGGAAVQAGWEPYSYRRHREPEAPRQLGRSSTILLSAALGQAVLIGAGAAPLVAVVGGRADYLAGAAFAFPIGLAFWLGTARQLLTTPLALRFRPELALVALGAAAVTTLGLDLVLVPGLGIYGAALAMLAGSLVGAVAGLALGGRYRMIAFEPRRLALAAVAGIAGYVSSGAVDTASDLADLILRPAVAGTVYVALLVALRVVAVPEGLRRWPVAFAYARADRTTGAAATIWNAVAFRLRRLLFGGASGARLARVGEERLWVDVGEWEGGNLWLGRAYEAVEMRVARSLVSGGDTVIDVGANAGVYTLMASRAAGPEGRVYAFEPGPAAFDLLARNVELAGAANVVLERRAVSDAAGAATLVVGRESGLASLGRTGRGSPAGAVAVECVTLDEYAAERGIAPVALLKVDVEGFEGHVLRGARALLERDRGIAVLAELANENYAPLGLRADDVVEWMHRLGFASWRVRENVLFARPGTPAAGRISEALGSPR